ncbi:hypothetical protein [Pseudomonas xantholysinigenes]|uniref:Uncharacterized protein n=1 Tax=Pseudomonas xantholysinigenes TaxID=2745490 RepID=A0A9E6PZA5_9PSED|nr:hypothetical protein [Pseudomonas xantholysinigenes]QXI40096.1 hypothetical protein HU772_008485 [Pseudomonas xantholysinigenes]
MPKGFKAVRHAVIAALESGRYLHAARGNIEVKNLLALGVVSAGEVIEIIRACDGNHHSSSPHHAVLDIEVHVLRRHGWYIKFYFIEPHTWFISVHR